MKYQKHNLHHHRCWTNLWHRQRERILSIWSRTNLEGRSLDWTSAHILPSVVVAGEITYGDKRRWASEAKALLEGLLWKNCY